MISVGLYIIGSVRGVAIWRCAYDKFFIPVNVCLHCFLSKIKYLCILRIQSMVLVCEGFHHYFGHGAIGALNQSVKLDLIFSIGFILYFLKMVWKLCSSLPLFIAQSTHFLTSTESRKACKDCSYTSFIRNIVHSL